MDIEDLPPPFEYYEHGATGHRDLEFLRAGSTALSVGVNLGDPITTLEGVRHLRPDLVKLSLSAIWRRFPSLTPLSRFTRLRRLYLGGDGQFSDFAAVAALQQLQTIGLNRRKDVDLSVLTSLPRLWHLNVSLGTLAADLGVLAGLPQLRWLELAWIRTLTDLSGVGRLSGLERLDLGQLTNVEVLPDLAAAPGLRSVYIDKCRNIRDLAPLAAAPALERLWLVDMPHLTPDDLRPLVGHPTLKYCAVGTGSERRNQAIKDVLGLPDPPGPDLPHAPDSGQEFAT